MSQVCSNTRLIPLLISRYWLKSSISKDPSIALLAYLTKFHGRLEHLIILGNVFASWDACDALRFPTLELNKLSRCPLRP
jgi:hypothetical protein